jgi:hypothetical protein
VVLATQIIRSGLDWPGVRPGSAVIAICLAAVGAGGCLGEPGCPAFAHIVATGFGRDGDVLSWTLEVQEIPAELTFNQRDVPAYFLEYRWAVDIDSDRNGAVDLRASIEHFAEMGGTPIVTGDILSQTNHNLLAVMGGLATVVGTVDASIAGNTFRFETTTAAAPGLADVTDPGQSTWTTSYRSGAELEDQCDEAVH